MLVQTFLIPKRWYQGLKTARVRTTVPVKCLLLAVACLVCTTVSFAQEQIRHYSIHRNGKQIGALKFYIREQSSEVQLKLDSEIKARVLLTFEMIAAEESRYQHNKLVFSSVRRYVNGSEKENKTITATGDKYQVNNKGAVSPLAYPPIRYSMLSLYAWEPAQVTHVFSDMNQKMLPIQKTGPGRYKVQFPEGKTSEFWYKSGICTKVVLNSQWYDAEIRLENIHKKSL